VHWRKRLAICLPSFRTRTREDYYCAFINFEIDEIGFRQYVREVKQIASGILPLIAIDPKSRSPLHQQIYDGYRAAIVNGLLRSGQRIPSTRALAIELGISRSPVLNAYAQLSAEGYLESRVGAGTVICKTLPDRFTASESAHVRSGSVHLGARSISRSVSAFPLFESPPWVRGNGAFAVGQVAFNQFPLNIWSSLVARHCRGMSRKAFQYGEWAGSTAFRETVASYLRTARSVRCEADQIMIVNGSQQGIDISARVLFDPGAQVWVEEPGYHLAKEALALAGCRLVPVPVDEEGLDVAIGIDRCRKARAAIVTPSHQFPLGFTMSAKRRLELLDWAQDTGSWIIEDDYDSEYRYDSSPIASLHGLDVNARVIYIGTFSKVLFPALRIGYIVVPPDLVDRFLTVRRSMEISPPSFQQDVLTDFIGEGHFARHIRRMRILYRERRNSLVDSINNELGSMVKVLGNEAGLHLTVTLATPVSDTEVAERAARQQLWIWPLSTSYLGLSETVSPGFILGYGNTPSDVIPRAVRKLRNLLDAQ
jgi:GntR family transcriptional regulator / MocR family aminotransferase